MSLKLSYILVSIIFVHLIVPIQNVNFILNSVKCWYKLLHCGSFKMLSAKNYNFVDENIILIKIPRYSFPLQNGKLEYQNELSIEF